MRGTSSWLDKCATVRGRSTGTPVIAVMFRAVAPPGNGAGKPSQVWRETPADRVCARASAVFARVASGHCCRGSALCGFPGARARDAKRLEKRRVQRACRPGTGLATLAGMLTLLIILLLAAVGGGLGQLRGDAIRAPHGHAEGRCRGLAGTSSGDRDRAGCWWDPGVEAGLQAVV